MAKLIGAIALVAGVIGAVALCGGQSPNWAPNAEPPPPDPTRFDARWWQSDQARCPDGTALRGITPPDGFEVWCARPDGTRDGQHIGWWPTGRQAFERHYRDGVLDGPYAEWREDGQRWRAGAYRDGLREGRWVTWQRDGSATITEYRHGVAAE